MTPRELLQSGALELNIPMTIEQINSIFIFLAELRKWNEKMNLTAIKDEQDIIIKHVLDSLSHVKGFAPSPGLRLLDMGSGAGFPALPIKIAFPELLVSLVDSVKKKASFLRHIVRTLKLVNAEVFDVRTQELPDSLHSSYDVVTARAFADMRAAITMGVPFLKPGGLMVLSRGPDELFPDQEMAKAGVVLQKRIDLTLPHSIYKRSIWVFKKPG